MDDVTALMTDIPPAATTSFFFYETVHLSRLEVGRQKTDRKKSNDGRQVRKTGCSLKERPFLGPVPGRSSAVLADSHASSLGAYLGYCDRGRHWLSTRPRGSASSVFWAPRRASAAEDAEGLEAGWTLLRGKSTKPTGRRGEPGPLLDRIH